MRVDYLLITGLILLVAFLNHLWANEETRPPHWDTGRHLWTSLLYLDLLHLKTIYRLWTNYYYYPPFRYWETVPFYLIFGKSKIVAIDSNIVFIAILAFSIYGIGKELWDRITGLMSAVFILSAPIYVSQFKEYQLDAELGSMVALSFYLLIRTKEFADRKLSLWFGLSAGLGMLTKWTYFISMGFPLAITLFQVFKDKSPGRKERFLNLFLAFLIALGVSLLWYGNHPRMLWNDLFGWTFYAEGGPYLSWDCQATYLMVLEQIQLQLFLTVIFLVGFLTSLFSKEARRKNGLLMGFVLGNYFLFTCIHKDARYTMPMLIGVAVLAVFWTGLLRHPALRTVVRSVILLYCVFSFWIVSFGTNLIPYEMTLGKWVVYRQVGYIIGPPEQEQWKQEDIVKKILSYPEAERGLFFEGEDTMFFNGWAFRYYCLEYGVPWVDQAEPPFIVARGKQLARVPKGCIPVERYPLPDGTQAILFKR